MVRKVEKVKTYQMGSNKQVYNFSKNVGQVSQENRNTSRRGRTSQFSIFYKISVEIVKKGKTYRFRPKNSKDIYAGLKKKISKNVGRDS